MSRLLLERGEWWGRRLSRREEYAATAVMAAVVVLSWSFPTVLGSLSFSFSLARSA